MTLILKQIFGLLKLLNSDTGHNQVAAGVAAGFILGMSPTLSLQSLLIFIFILFFRIQAGAAFIAAFFFAFIAYLLDPIFHSVGSQILQNEALTPFFTTLYNMPIVPFTKFYNSVVMGAGVVAICTAPFLFLISRSLIIKYRKTVLERIKQTKIWKAIKALSLIHI